MNGTTWLFRCRPTGISESAPVAITFFLVHLATLTLLLIDCLNVAIKGTAFEKSAHRDSAGQHAQP
jgi:hypothetical protein